MPIGPNRLMDLEVVSASNTDELALLNILAEFGGGISLVINREIAEHAIAELQAFLDGRLRQQKVANRN
jgi:hypothetical protein